MICENCKSQDSNGSAIIAGKYWPNICSACKLLLNSGQSVNSGEARWQRDIDIQDHEVDVAQPYGADGNPNLMFIQAYPDKARAIFTEEQIRNANFR